MWIVILGEVLFAAAISLNKTILVWLSPAFFVGIRRLSSGLILFTYKAFTSSRLRLCYLRYDILTIFLISTMTMFIPSILKAYGFKYLVSSKAALIGSLDPFVTALFAYFLWGEKLTRNKFIGMMVAFSGILYLLISTSPTEQILGEWGIFSLPELAVLGSVVISRYGWILARKILKDERYKPSELNSLIMLCSGICALTYSYFSGTCDFCSIPPTFKFAALFSYSVLMGDIFCYNIYGYMLKKYNLTFLSICGLSIPLLIHLYGPFLHGEPITLTFFVALGIVLLGTIIFYRADLKEIKKSTL